MLLGAFERRRTSCLVHGAGGRRDGRMRDVGRERGRAADGHRGGGDARERPVMMTALAFIVGVIPLAVATGAGAGARQSIGTTVFGGMVLASFIGILFVPPLFVAFELMANATMRRIRGRGQPVRRQSP
jgi:hypothetical protein